MELVSLRTFTGRCGECHEPRPIQYLVREEGEDNYRFEMLGPYPHCKECKAALPRYKWEGE